MIPFPSFTQRPMPPKPEPKAKKAAKVRDSEFSMNPHHKAVDAWPHVSAAQTNSSVLWPLQKEKAVNDKKEDKKTKKAKENAEAEANEENHSENGEAKTNEVGRLIETKFLTAGEVCCSTLHACGIDLKTRQSFHLGLSALSHRWRQPPRRPRRRPSPSSTTAQASSSSSSTIPLPPLNRQPASPPSLSHGFPPRRIVNRGIFLSMIL